MRSAAKLALVLIAAAGALAGCGPRHEFTRLENGDHTLVATVDYVRAGLGLTQNAVVSVQEKHGLASLVATFGNIQRIEVSWLGPEDLNICQVGQVIGYKTAIPLNTSRGPRTVHVRYGC
jgi:hypothetical protein